MTSRPTRRRLALILVAFALLLASIGHVPTEAFAADAQPEPEFTTISELSGRRVGTAAGSIFDQLTAEYAPGITEFSYFTSYADSVAALKSGKVDALIFDEPPSRLIVKRNTGLALLPEPLAKDEYGFVLAKGSSLTSQINEVIERFRADGTLEALEDKWLGADEDAKTLPTQDWDTSAGVLRVVTNSDNEPMAYLREGEIVGYDVEIVMLCARELGMGVRMADMPFEAVLSSVQSGKADVAVGGISLTDERRQVSDLTVPTYYGSATFIVRSLGEVSEPSLLDGLAASFERTFITEGRWRLVFSGLGVTLLVSVSSGVLGTLLGFCAVLLRRRGNRAAGAVVSAFEGLMSRLPIVVVLMVFYYVIFGSTDVSGVVVAILVFSLAFGAGAGSIMWNAVCGVDIGQTEASLALGFDDTATFFGVVMPQAARSFLPLLQGQFVSLVKDTSVVGYIAVADLTRMGDLIRSRTMEAFFPLFATAGIYFALCCVLAGLIGMINRHLDLAHRPRTIKGVGLGSPSEVKGDGGVSPTLLDHG